MYDLSSTPSQPREGSSECPLSDADILHYWREGYVLVRSLVGAEDAAAVVACSRRWGSGIGCSTDDRSRGDRGFHGGAGSRWSGRGRGRGRGRCRAASDRDHLSFTVTVTGTRPMPIGIAQGWCSKQP